MVAEKFLSLLFSNFEGLKFATGITNCWKQQNKRHKPPWFLRRLTGIKLSFYGLPAPYRSSIRNLSSIMKSTGSLPFGTKKRHCGFHRSNKAPLRRPANKSEKVWGSCKATWPARCRINTCAMRIFLLLKKFALQLAAGVREIRPSTDGLYLFSRAARSGESKWTPHYPNHLWINPAAYSAFQRAEFSLCDSVG